MAIPFSYGVRNLWTRKLTTVLTAGGMALVSFVFAAVLMLAEGLERTLIDTGSPDNVIVLRGAAETEVSSVIERDSAAVVEVQPEVSQTGAGDLLASKETLVLVNVPKRGTHGPMHVVVRGVSPKAVSLRPQVKLIQGRFIQPGSREVVAGKKIVDAIAGGGLGATLNFALADWTIVGVIDAAGTAFDSELWVDCDQLMAAFRRNTYSVVILHVPGRKAFEDLKRRLASDPRLSVQVKREMDFYREQSEMMAKFIRILGMSMTVFFSVGAVLGAMVTMYAAVANRTREIGTLRALGFSRPHILLTFLMESLVLGLIGGAVGIGTSSLLQVVTISTMNWQSFAELAFGFTLTADIAIYTMTFGVAMGLLGGVFPAWRASRLQIVEALRAT